MFHNKIIQRVISAVIIVTFTSLTMYPYTAMAQVHDALDKAGQLPKQKDEGVIGNAKRYLDKLTGNRPSKASGNPDERFSQLLAAIHEDLKAVSPDTALPA